MSDDDDYMSEDFIKAAETTQITGLSTSHTQKRALKLERLKYENELSHAKKPKRAELEVIRREEALSKPVCESSKGFALMAKMGFKPGMSLGKKKDENDMGSGIREPLPLEVKLGKKGLGHDTKMGLLPPSKGEMDGRRERIKAEFSRMKDNVKRHDELLVEFRQRKRDDRTTKKLVVDIIKCRKTCLDLDMRIDKQLPQEPWFWKSYPVKGDEDDLIPRRPDDQDDRDYVYGNGEPASKEERFDEMSEEELKERLISIVTYLRQEHQYCAWCGHVFSSAKEMEENCDGPLPEDHEEHEGF